MADDWTGGQASSGERWNVNLPAVVGVVFVLLLGVVIWVIATSGDDDAIQSIDSTASSVASSVASTTTTRPPTTSPQPMPVTTPAATTAVATIPPAAVPTAPPPPPPTAPPAPPPPPPAPPPAPTTTAATTTTPPTTTPASTTRPPDGGDLGVEGHPIQEPPCDGGYITVLASAVGDDATADGLRSVLDDYDGSSYLRTDQTCPSLTQSVDGDPVYVVFFGPFEVDADACAARDDGPDGAYVRRLSDELSPSHSVNCSG